MAKSNVRSWRCPHLNYKTKINGYHKITGVTQYFSALCIPTTTTEQQYLEAVRDPTVGLQQCWYMILSTSFFKWTEKSLHKLCVDKSRNSLKCSRILNTPSTEYLQPQTNWSITLKLYEYHTYKPHVSTQCTLFSTKQECFKDGLQTGINVLYFRKYSATLTNCIGRSTKGAPHVNSNATQSINT